MDERNIISFSFDFEATLWEKLDRDFEGAINMILVIFLILYKEKIETNCLSLTLTGSYMFKVNNRNTRTNCEICSRLTIKTPERRHCRGFGVFIVDFEHISLSLTLV